MKSPCYKCPRRSLICHAQCETYHKWVARLREIDRARRVAVDADAHIKATADKVRRGEWR